MFTGLIEEIGVVSAVAPNGEGAIITIEAATVLEGIRIGDSIAISGPCQTVTAFNSRSFTVQAVRETMQRTRFGMLRKGDRVNLERAMRPSDRMGGHMVQGHVDGLIELKRVQPLAGSWRLTLALPPEGKPFIVEKGSVALDGVSLTVAATTAESFDLEVIPHTYSHTTLSDRKAGDKLHVEWDIIAKYVNHVIQVHRGESGISAETLFASGFGR